MDMMMEIWANGDEEKFEAMINELPEFENENERALYNEYNNAMIVNRNISMTDFAEEALRSGEEVFICVGAGHVVGSEGIAELLSQRGYTVKKVK